MSILRSAAIRLSPTVLLHRVHNTRGGRNSPNEAGPAVHTNAVTSIPFSRPVVTGREMQYVSEVLASGHLSGDGPFTMRCQALLEETLGARKAFLTTSGTHALEIAALLLDLKPGDEFIVPSFTFVSTANAFALRGARPVFCDVRSDTLNLDESRLPGLISPQTRAIVAVHYAGVACEMDAIGRLAGEHDIAVIEDNAHGLFGSYCGRPLGTLGALSAQSFHDTKNYTCGEGGALLINDPQYTAPAEIIREKGTNRSRFFRGEIDRYTWVSLGSSYLPSELLAAFLLAQMEQHGEIQERRRTLWLRYHEQLRDWAHTHGVQRPTVPEQCESSNHIYHMLMPTLDARTALMTHLRARGVQATFHYQPLHTSEMGQHFGGRVGHCPVTERIVDLLIRLPLYPGLSDDDQARVIDAVCEFHP